MSRRAWAWIAIGLGLAVLLSRWGDVLGFFVPSGGRPYRVNLWSSASTVPPDVAEWQAREFMARHPDVEVTWNQAQSGPLQDFQHMSFMAGRPPDLLYSNRSELRQLVAEGFIRPLEEMIERQRGIDASPIDDVLGGDLRWVRFTCDPDDRFLRERDRRPLQAARLLAMHGRVVGVAQVGYGAALTYNKRIFRKAAAMFPDEGLLDERGEPRPPATWSELLRVSRVIAAYGRRVHEEARVRGEDVPRVYPVALRAQFPVELWQRTVIPLANRAGGNLFDFAGDERDGVRQGRFRYDHPAYLGALRLLIELRRHDCILPGTTSREYEETRAMVGAGRAAMLIDSWVAAVIAIERNPWARDDLGSAAVPVADAAIAERYGLPLRAGRLQRLGADDFQFVVSSNPHPWPVWQWLMAPYAAEAERAAGLRGLLPLTQRGMGRLDDPAWFPFAFQAEAVRALDDSSALWPAVPRHAAIRNAIPPGEAMHAALQAASLPPDDGAAVEAVRTQLAAYSEGANANLAAQIERGEVDIADYTFPDFDPADPEATLRRQLARARDPAVDARIAQMRRELPPELRDPTIGFRPGASPLLALWVPGILLALVAAFGVTAMWRNRRLPPARRLRLAQVRDAWPAYVLVAPMLVMLAALTIYPALDLVALSFRAGDGVTATEPVGWRNYRDLLRDGVFWGRAVPNTLIYMVVITAAQIACGLALAVLLNHRLRGMSVYRLLFFVPMVVSLSVVSVVFFGLLSGSDSALNRLLEAVGLGDLAWYLGLVAEPGRRLDWLGDQRTGMWCVILVAIWQGLPFTVILLLAGLQSIPAELHEAAQVDGAGACQRFRHVTLPALLPILGIIAFNSLIGASHIMGPIYVLTRGGVGGSSDSVATYIFKQGFHASIEATPNIGYACALGIVYALLMAALTGLQMRFVARRLRRREGADAA